jgi:toxin YhaV
LKVGFEDIPSDPTREVYRQGDTLGDAYKHWHRAKFLQQFRLFFRYHRAGDTKIIVLAWVNNDDRLRAYGSATDAYAVYRKMLKQGDPPDDRTTLLTNAKAAATQDRLKGLAPAKADE